MADATFEARVGEETLKFQLSGMKKRTVEPNPLLESETVVIHLMEQGVEWRYDPSLKMFEEKPLSSALRDTSIAAAAKDRPATMKKLPQTRTVAGLAAVGYQFVFPDQQTLILWMAPETEDVAKIRQEIRAYQSAWLQRAYANEPARLERETASEVVPQAGFFSNDLASKIRGIRDLPPGFMLALEWRDTGAKTSEIVFEIKSLSAAPLEAPTFAIPEGFMKVSNLMEEQIKGK